MSNLAQELLEIKEEIEQTEKNKASLEGKLEIYMRTLQKDWECKTIKEAYTRLKQMEVLLAEHQTKLTKIVEKLKDYGWKITICALY